VCECVWGEGGVLLLLGPHHIQSSTYTNVVIWASVPVLRAVCVLVEMIHVHVIIHMYIGKGV